MYTSDDEDCDICVLCKESIDDPIEFGQMISVGKFKVHLFCCVSQNIFPLFLYRTNIFRIFIVLFLNSQLLSPKLSKRDDENGSTFGFRESDIKLEVNRASRLVTFREINEKVASIKSMCFCSCFRPSFIAKPEGRVLDAVQNNAANRSIFRAA